MNGSEALPPVFSVSHKKRTTYSSHLPTELRVSAFKPSVWLRRVKKKKKSFDKLRGNARRCSNQHGEEAGCVTAISP